MTPTEIAQRFRHDIDRPDCIILSTQRSGTHFLLHSLASDPRIFGRDECLMHFRHYMTGEAGERDARLVKYHLRNSPGKKNIAIVMYSQMDLFTALFGALDEMPTVHLLRDPHRVAESEIQMRIGKAGAGANYQPHYRIGEAPPRRELVDVEAIHRRATTIGNEQRFYRKLLATHPKTIEVTYEDLTDGVQTNVVSDVHAALLLSFLGLTYGRPLVNDLQKTSR